MKNYLVRVTFQSGIIDYNFPLVYFISDPKEGIRANVVSGIATSGSKVIPGGKKSIEIIIRGALFAKNYADLLTLRTTLEENITTDVGTLTLKHWSGSEWVNSWSYTVRRVSEIIYEESLRTFEEKYQVSFLVLGY